MTSRVVICGERVGGSYARLIQLSAQASKPKRVRTEAEASSGSLSRLVLATLRSDSRRERVALWDRSAGACGPSNALAAGSGPESTALVFCHDHLPLASRVHACIPPSMLMAAISRVLGCARIHPARIAPADRPAHAAPGSRSSSRATTPTRPSPTAPSPSPISSACACTGPLSARSPPSR
jgi:hypothetical protein